MGQEHAAVERSPDVPSACLLRSAGEDRRVESAGGGTAQAGVSEAVVHVPLVGVREDRVGLGCLLEFFFSFFIHR